MQNIFHTAESDILEKCKQHLSRASVENPQLMFNFVMPKCFNICRCYFPMYIAGSLAKQTGQASYRNSASN